MTACAPTSTTFTGIWPNDCTASVWNGTPASLQSAAIARTGSTVPTSLFAHITVHSATSPPRSDSLIWARLTRPRASTPSHSTWAPSCAANHSTGSRTAWCSIDDARTLGGVSTRGSRCQNRPLTARLSDSVPPDVKMTALGLVPRSAAILSRASSTTWRTKRPAVWSEEGFPTISDTCNQRDRAAGSIGVVAAWSKYARCVTGPMVAGERGSRRGASPRPEGDRPGSTSSLRRALRDFVGQLRNDGEQVTHDAIVGEFEDRCLSILIHHDDRL